MNYLKRHIFNILHKLSYIVGFLLKRSYLSIFTTVTTQGGQLIFGHNVRIYKRSILNLGQGHLEIADNVWVNHDVEFNAGDLLSIGYGTTIQKYVTINGDVRIGEQCLLAPNVFISSGSHVFDAYPGMNIREQEQRMKSEGKMDAYNKPIVIGNDVWIGANAVIMQGVTIGDHVVIGANSVVTKDIMSFSVVGGIPAKILKKRD